MRDAWLPRGAYPVPGLAWGLLTITSAVDINDLSCGDRKVAGRSELHKVWGHLT
jgi:hypothetical protein